MAQREEWCGEFLSHGTKHNCAAYFERAERIQTDEWSIRRDAAIAALTSRSFSGQDLRHADLREAQLEGVDLSFARLEGADLGDARLEGADLRGARLGGASLRGTRLESADLREARLQGVFITGARLEMATLVGARLEMAVLGDTELVGADLRLARLEGAIFFIAGLEGANLGRAQLEGAWFHLAHFDERTEFEAAVLQYAAVSSSDLSKTNITQDQVNAMFGDGSVALPAWIVRPAHWPAGELDPGTFENELNTWRADPSSYVPPAPRP